MDYMRQTHISLKYGAGRVRVISSLTLSHGSPLFDTERVHRLSRYIVFYVKSCGLLNDEI
jgi:hypothetical protein